MSDQTLSRPLVDYLKFIIPMDYDRAQQVIPSVAASIQGLQGIEVDNVGYKMTVLSPTESSGMRSRYVIEVWGLAAHHAITLVPSSWWEHLTRIDARYTLKNVSADALGSFINRNIMQRTSKKNVTTFDTRPRQKTNTRDVGGRGIVFGSRKSDIHTAIYARGEEAVALEVRFQNRKADHIGNLALFEKETGEAQRNFYEVLLANLNVEAMTELYKITACHGTAKLESLMNRDSVDQAKLKAASDWLETEAEKVWWESLTPEEQEEWQKDGFIPTEMCKPKLRS